MFLKSLAPEERNAALSMAYRMMAADGEFALEERELMKVLLLECNQEPDIMNIEVLGLEEAAALLQNEVSRRTVLMELAILAHSDREFAPSEKVFLDKAQLAMGLEPGDTAMAVALAKRWLNWRKSVDLWAVRGTLEGAPLDADPLA